MSDGLTQTLAILPGRDPSTPDYAWMRIDQVQPPARKVPLSAGTRIPRRQCQAIGNDEPPPELGTWGDGE